jgi:diadenosine tetraphosphate (Ap4A) HIT family hydrolase
MEGQCRLCDALGAPGNKAHENTILMETDHFAVMPTLGQFVEGWLMIAAKRHTRCSREHGQQEIDELERLLAKAQHIIQTTYGPTIVFEHGPSCVPSRHAGCSVEHTHVHIAPCTQINAFNQKIAFPRIGQCTLSEIPRATPAEDCGYLMASTAEYNTRFNVYRVESPAPRQYLRQILAVVTNRAPLWDWRASPCRENIERTVAQLSENSAMDMT